ncbi:MAG: hypothetical protein AABX38_07310 [Candidatus Micrarchaeota archaeon]
MSPFLEVSNEQENGKTKTSMKPRSDVSFFDINQLELAVIYHALEGNPDAPAKFSHVEVGDTKRILEIQRDNLAKYIYAKGKQVDPKLLKKELDLLLLGKKVLSPKCFPPLKDKHKETKEKDSKGSEQKN